MMHKWESVEGMVHEWEEQEIGDPFVYQDFQYELSEFDNLPPVIPRFQFYIQQYLKPIIRYMKSLHDGISVDSLREETHNLIKEKGETIQTTENRLQNFIDKLNSRCNNLQSQIDDMNNQKAAHEKETYLKGQESLVTADDFDLDLSSTESASSLHHIGKFE